MAHRNSQYHASHHSAKLSTILRVAFLTVCHSQPFFNLFSCSQNPSLHFSLVMFYLTCLSCPPPQKPKKKKVFNKCVRWQPPISQCWREDDICDREWEKSNNWTLIFTFKAIINLKHHWQALMCNCTILMVWEKRTKPPNVQCSRVSGAA